MKNSSISILLITLLVFVANGFVFNSTGLAALTSPQDAEKSLEIERHANQPFELVELKVGEQPIQDKITVKFRGNDAGLDSVTFKERDGWFKRVWVRLRNISGKQIYGVSAFLYFQPSNTRTRYSLPLVASTELKQGVVEPNGEVILTVTEQAWTLTTDMLNQQGVNPDLASVRLGLDSVRFSDKLQWVRGTLLQPDPNNPLRWIRPGKTDQ